MHTVIAACNPPAKQGEITAPPMPIMNESQLKQARKLIRAECANYDYGNCVMLDGRFGTCACPQLLSYSLLCKYFRTAVLPAEQGLYAEIMAHDSRRYCGDCHQPFSPMAQNALYCKSCASRRTRLSKREWARKNKGKK